MDTALIAAAREKHVEVVRELIAKRADVEAINAKGETALMWAAARDSVPMAEALIAAGAQVDYREDPPKHCATPLVWSVARLSSDEKNMDQGVHWAISRWPEAGGQVALLLLERGADPNHALFSEPPLVYAAICALEPVVDRMLERGADPLKGGSDGTVLGNVESRLAGYGETDIKDRIVARLRRAIEDTPTAAALVEAARKGDVARVEALLAKGVPVDEHCDHKSALREAAAEGHVALVRRLLAAGADVNAVSWTNRSALGAAAVAGHAAVVRELVAAGANMGTARALVGPGSTPLCHAACNGRLEVVQALIAAGAPVEPDPLALSIEKADIPHIPAAVIEALNGHILAARAKNPAAVERPITPPCPCQSFGGSPTSHEGDDFRVERSVVHQGWSEIYCQCQRCHRRWKVESDSGYHYTTYNWSNVTGSS
jgi:ankyrin repeat protein